MLPCLRPWSRCAVDPLTVGANLSPTPTQTLTVWWCITDYNHSRHWVAGVLREA